MVNSVVSDQTDQISLLLEQSDLGLHCLPRSVCLNISDYYGCRIEAVFNSSYFQHLVQFKFLKII